MSGAERLADHLERGEGGLTGHTGGRKRPSLSASRPYIPHPDEEERHYTSTRNRSGLGPYQSGEALSTSIADLMPDAIPIIREKLLRGQERELTKTQRRRLQRKLAKERGRLEELVVTEVWTQLPPLSFNGTEAKEFRRKQREQPKPKKPERKPGRPRRGGRGNKFRRQEKKPEKERKGRTGRK